MKFIVVGLRFLFSIFLLSVAISTITYATPKDSGELALESDESQEEMRRRILTTVESAKQYQDMMDEQLKSLKSENKDLHEKLMKLKDQFESVMTGVGANLQQNSQTPVSKLNSAADEQNSTPTSAAAEPMPQATPVPMQPAPEASVPVAVSETTVTNAVLTAPPVMQKPAEVSDRFRMAFSNLKLMGGLLILGLLILFWFLWGSKSKPSELPGRKNSFQGAAAHNSGLKTEAGDVSNNVKNLTIPAQKMVVPMVATSQEGEYDYIGSIEGIPARMDLARMYCGMGDVASAELVLKSIMAQGNDAQFLEASELLEEMKKRS